MTAFGITIINTESVRKFVEDTNKRLEDNNMLKNPFRGKLLLLQDSIIIYIRPIYPNICPYIAMTGILAPYLINAYQYTNWSLLGLPFLILSIFWSKYFYYYTLRKGLLKNTLLHKKEIKLLNTEETIKRIVNGSK